MTIHNGILFHSLLKCVESNESDEVKTMINKLCVLLSYITFVYYIQCVDLSKTSVTVFVNIP